MNNHFIKLKYSHDENLFFLLSRAKDYTYSTGKNNNNNKNPTTDLLAQF